MHSFRRLRKLLDQAIALDRAAKGNIQILDRETGELHLLVQRGFDAAFSRYFKKVRAFDASACGRALGSGDCVIISDVMHDPDFQPHRVIAGASGFRSVKSIPIAAKDGSILGMLSTHSPSVRWDWERENTRPIAAKIATVLARLSPARWAAIRGPKTPKKSRSAIRAKRARPSKRGARA